MLRIERIEDADRFALMGEEWNALLHESDADCLFLTWVCPPPWGGPRAGRRRWSLPAARPGEGLVALAPLAVAPPQLGRFLPFRSFQLLGTGTVGSDYLDLIVRAHGPRAEQLKRAE